MRIHRRVSPGDVSEEIQNAIRHTGLRPAIQAEMQPLRPQGRVRNRDHVPPDGWHIIELRTLQNRGSVSRRVYECGEAGDVNSSELGRLAAAWLGGSICYRGLCAVTTRQRLTLRSPASRRNRDRLRYRHARRGRSTAR